MIWSCEIHVFRSFKRKPHTCFVKTMPFFEALFLFSRINVFYGGYPFLFVKPKFKDKFQKLFEMMF